MTVCKISDLPFIGVGDAEMLSDKYPLSCKATYKLLQYMLGLGECPTLIFESEYGTASKGVLPRIGTPDNLGGDITNCTQKLVKTEEVLVDRSYVVEYHGYSAEDVKLLINQEE